jgi:predicted oxidoreductase
VAAAKVLATEYGVSYDMILLAWLSSHPARIIPVLGTTRIQRIKDAAQAVSIKLTGEQWYMILSAQLGHDVP